MKSRKLLLLASACLLAFGATGCIYHGRGIGHGHRGHHGHRGGHCELHVDATPGVHVQLHLH